MIEFWMIYIIVSLLAIIIEMLIPSTFFINFAFAGIITAILSIFWGSTISLLLVFLAISIISIIFVKPHLVKRLKKEETNDFNSKYIGKVAKCIEPITITKGAISIYDERWEARTEHDSEEIPVDSEVKIVKNDSLILFVEKI